MCFFLPLLMCFVLKHTYMPPPAKSRGHKKVHRTWQRLQDPQPPSYLMNLLLNCMIESLILYFSQLLLVKSLKKKALSCFKTKLILIWILCRAITWNDKRISHPGNDMLPCFYLWRRWLKLPRTQSAWEGPAERLAAGEGTDEMRH